MTSPTHASGTDRLAEVAAAAPCGLLVNIQGDEPLLDPAVIDAAVLPLMHDASIAMGTAARRLRNEQELTNPEMVKVVCDAAGFALYFSRAPIPHGRDGSPLALARIHVGLYVYRRDALLRLAASRRARSNEPKRWNSCARSNTASASRSSIPSSNRTK